MRFAIFGLMLLIGVARINGATYFVDYLGGVDSNLGTSSNLAWRHCPGDPAATGIAGVVTFFPGDTVRFKGGVSYVFSGGAGIALNWDGAPGSAITYDGNSTGTWGSGPATFTDNYGANAITAFSTNAYRRYLTFKSLEFYGIGGSATLPADLGSPVAPRFGGGIQFGGGAEGVVIDGCVFREIGYWFNQKPMNATSITGVGISISGGQGLVISNCDFSRVGVACDFSSGTLSSVEVTRSNFRDSIVWPVNLSAAASTTAQISVSDSSFLEGANFGGTVWTGYGYDPRTEVVTVNAGAPVMLAASVIASPAAMFQWRKNGVPIPGANGFTLLLPSVGSIDGGIYSVVATNGAGSTMSNSAFLAVGGIPPPAGNPDTQFPTGEMSAPAITMQPVSQTANVQGTVTFNAAASGSPAPTYQWTKNGAPIPGATGSMLRLEGLTINDAARYALVATNSAGSIVSNEAILAVNYAPSFTMQPMDRVATEFTTVMFTAAATGSPAPTYQWLKDGLPLSGATNASLTLPSVTNADAGRYSAVAQNSLGSAMSAAAQLTLNFAPVNFAPVITTQPSSQFVMNLSNVSLSAMATGVPTPTYQWLKNGVPIAGATTTTLTFAAVTVTDAAKYSMMASNSVGSVVSNEATLSVSQIVGTTNDNTGVSFDPISVLKRVESNGAGGSANATFVVPGTASKKILVRAAGPSLASFETGVMADPKLDLYQDWNFVASNDNWGGSSELINAFNQVGAFPFVSADSKDAALLVTLAPGGYTIYASGVNGAMGAVLIEVFEVR